MKSNRLRHSIALGTSFTALFLLVNCEVAERDYSVLNIGGSAARGPDDFLSADAGSGDASVGGPVGPEPLPPVPCSEDAGVSADVDAAGSADAGAADAGIQSPCTCVDGFYEALDADGDGDGTRLCAIAPGLDCDDGDPTVTHNSCGGCSALPNAVGEDCLECGAYACDGTDALTCASKPGPVVDPDCRCQDALIVARDTDQDGQGTRLCEANPGLDCNDGDETFVANECGGCEALPGAVGAACNECGVYSCNGAALVCAPPQAAGCLDANTRGTCVGTGFWTNETDCTGGNNFCYQGNCEVCMPGTFQCVDLGGGSTQVQVCGSTSSASIGWTSYDSCVPGETCNPNNGACTGYLMWPRDSTFEVVPLLERDGLRWHDELNTASESDYG